MRMLADGWPLALAGFAAGLAVCAWMSRGRASGERGAPVLDAHDGDALAAIEAEIRAARDALEAEAAETDDAAEAVKGLDEAVKRANGRLKLLLKAVEKAD